MFAKIYFFFFFSGDSIHSKPSFTCSHLFLQDYVEFQLTVFPLLPLKYSQLWAIKHHISNTTKQIVESEEILRKAKKMNEDCKGCLESDIEVLQGMWSS